MDPRAIWGKVNLALKQNNLAGLHAICINIANVWVKGGDFIISAESQQDEQTLKKAQNYRNLVETFSSLGYNYNIIITVESKDTADTPEMIVQRLSEAFGEHVEIIRTE